MSLESSFSQKLNLNSSSAHQTSLGKGTPSGPGDSGPQSNTLTVSSTSHRPSTSSSSSSSSQAHQPAHQPSSKTAAFKNLGRSRPSLSKNQSFNREESPSPGPLSGASSTSSTHSFAASTVGGVDRAHSVRLTRKIFHNWRSACGKTKDRTKDFIRRWKTLPENHPDFDNIVANQPAGTDGTNIPAPTAQGSNHAESHGGFSKIKSLAKKTSDNDVLHPLNRAVSKDEDTGAPSSSAGKSSKGWTVHVWATYVQRGSLDEEALNEEEAAPGRTLLSDFQKVKLTHFFRHVLDMNHDDVISAADFVALNQRIRHYVEWSCECIEFHILKEVHSGFLECFLNQPLDDCSHMYYCSKDRETRDHVNVDEWLDVWGELLKGSRNLENLPLWLQYFPKILFQVINKSGSGTISREELRAFYTMFLGIDFRVVNETLESIYNAMTDNGRNKINYSLFKLCFTNFLLAKHPHGPGQYLFGICSPQTLICSFPIDYSALNTPPSDLEPYNPDKDKKETNRRSVIV